MLYLLRSDCGREKILTIGYAANIKSAVSRYRDFNPGIKLVSKKKGEPVDEVKLRLYLMDNGYIKFLLGDWYMDDPKVINTFNDYPSKEVDKYLWENRVKLFDNTLGVPLMEQAYKSLLSTVGANDHNCTVIEKQYQEILDNRRFNGII